MIIDFNNLNEETINLMKMEAMEDISELPKEIEFLKQRLEEAKYIYDKITEYQQNQED